MSPSNYSFKFSVQNFCLNYSFKIVYFIVSNKELYRLTLNRNFDDSKFLFCHIEEITQWIHVEQKF